MASSARRGGLLVTALLAALVLLAGIVLVRLLTADGTIAGGPVDGNTPAVAGARVTSDALKRAALAAAEEQYADETAEIVGSGIISVTSSDAKVLLFVDTDAEAPDRASLRRIVVTLVRDGEAWELTGDQPV